MKINKRNIIESFIGQETKETEVVEALTEAEEIETEEISDSDMSIDNIETASVPEIADAVQAAAEEASDGKETFSDDKATKIATEVKTHAKGLDRTAWAPLDVPSVLTNKLDLCLAKSMVAKKSGRRDGTDILITGLPGSGKTGITKQWAKDRGVNLFYLNAKNDDLGAILNGFPVDTTEEDGENGKIHRVVRSYSSALDPLKLPNSVLFLDEFNRAAPKLRASLLTLINEHEVEGPGKDGIYRFENMLFTVACINPAVPTDPGAMTLNDAEMSRFVTKLDWDSNVKDARNYIGFYVNKTINSLDKTDEDYAYLYKEHKKIYNLAMYLFNDPRFEFDTREDLNDLFHLGKTMLNQRALTDGLMAYGSDKADFLDWIDHSSGFLQKDIEMFHEILDDYVEPEVDVPGVEETGASDEEAENAPVSASDETEASDSDDFDSVFGQDGDETDTDLFGTSVSKAGQAAKVSATDALNRIKGFDFTL